MARRPIRQPLAAYHCWSVLSWRSSASWFSTRLSTRKAPNLHPAEYALPDVRRFDRSPLAPRNSCAAVDAAVAYIAGHAYSSSD